MEATIDGQTIYTTGTISYLSRRNWRLCRSVSGGRHCDPGLDFIPSDSNGVAGAGTAIVGFSTHIPLARTHIPAYL